MMRAKAIGWVRDSKGKVVRHTYKDVCNCLTTFCGGGITTLRQEWAILPRMY